MIHCTYYIKIDPILTLLQFKNKMIARGLPIYKKHDKND